MILITVLHHENTKINYEKLTLLINEFLNEKNLDLKKVSEIYVNRGPGSFAGLRTSFSIVKSISFGSIKLIIIVLVLTILLKKLILDMKIYQTL